MEGSEVEVEVDKGEEEVVEEAAGGEEGGEGAGEEEGGGGEDKPPSKVGEGLSPFSTLPGGWIKEGTVLPFGTESTSPSGGPMKEKKRGSRTPKSPIVDLTGGGESHALVGGKGKPSKEWEGLSHTKVVMSQDQLFSELELGVPEAYHHVSQMIALSHGIVRDPKWNIITLDNTAVGKIKEHLILSNNAILEKWFMLFPEFKDHTPSDGTCIHTLWALKGAIANKAWSESDCWTTTKGRCLLLTSTLCSYEVP